MESILRYLPSWQKASPLIQRKTVLDSALLVTVGLVLGRQLWNDYSKWYNLGKGGVPQNLYGYTLSLILGQFGDEDVNSTMRYARDGQVSELEGISFLDGPVDMRIGPKPHISKWAAPVRQLSAMSPESVKQKLFSVLSDHAVSSHAKFDKSIIEGGTHRANALHIAGDNTEPARRFVVRAPSEIYHVHPSDGSAHAIVSAADAKILIESGWSERHPLSGASIGGFPSTYIMIYAPRTNEEIAIHEMVIRAATRYATRHAASTR